MTSNRPVKPSRLVKNWYRREARIARELSLKPPSPLKEWAREQTGRRATVCRQWLSNKGTA
jgi:hypothetical protein